MKTQVSRGMLLALVATLVLTVASFAVRQWRQSRVEPPEPVALASPETAPKPAVAETAAPTLASGAPESKAPAASPGLRPALPGATTNAMASRQPPAPPPTPIPQANDAPPPLPVLPPPAFRLIGRYVDKRGPVAFFVHEDRVLAARRGEKLPGDFVLRTIREDRVTVLRPSNKETIDMPLGTP